MSGKAKTMPKLINFANTLGALNGYVYLNAISSTGENKILAFEYCTPFFNDYGEWRISIAELDKTKFETYKDINQIVNDVLIKIAPIDIDKLFKEIELFTYENEFGIDDFITYTKYTAPTYEELQSVHKTIDDYLVGEYLHYNEIDHTKNEEDCKYVTNKKLEDFEANYEIQKLALNILLSLISMKDKIFKSSKSIYMS